MNVTLDYIRILAECIVYLAGLYSIYKFVVPFIKKFFHKRKIVSVENISHINDLVHRALSKVHILMDLNNVCVYVCKPTGECIYASSALCKLFGKQEKEMHGYGWVSAISENYRELEFNKWINSVKNKTPYISVYPIEVNNILKHISTKADAVPKIEIDGKEEEEILFYIGYTKEVI